MTKQLIRLSPQAPIVICGPTGSGKTALALKLAQVYNGELINADSRQIYKYLDIGTNKESLTHNPKLNTHYLGNIPIHLVSFLAPGQSYSVARYQSDAKQVIAQIKGRGKLPIIVGGTGMYIDALLCGYALLPGETDPKLRAELSKLSVSELQKRLPGVVLDQMNQSDRHNPRRLVRAVERLELQTDQPQLNRLSPGKMKSPNESYQVIYLDLSIAELEPRLRKRAEHMWQQGIVAETQEVLALGYSVAAVALQGIGYRQVLDYLAGKLSQQECIQQIYIAHRQYAKRQITWFKKHLPRDAGSSTTLQLLTEVELRSVLN